MVISVDVTLRSLSLGAQDSITGWYAKTFSESTVKMPTRPKGQAFWVGDIGVYPRFNLSGFTQDDVQTGDEIKDPFLKYYDVHEIADISLGDTFLWRECELVRNDLHYDRPATYGTGPTVDDPRYRSIDYLEHWLDPNHLLKDNGSSLATYIYQWEGADYPITKVFQTKDVDLIFSICRTQSTPLVGSEGVYGYLEKLPIKIWTLNKTGITGENLGYQAETELRKIFEAHPLGSYREINSFKPQPVQLGSLTLYQTQVEFDYKRGKT